MGWSYCHAWETKSDIIRYLTGPERNGTGDRVLKTLARCVKGNTLYAVQQWVGVNADVADDKPFIMVYSLASDNKRGNGWGYNGWSESCGPTDLGCPVKYFDMVPDPGGYATGWRARVLALAATRSAKRPKVGEVWSLRGAKPSVFRITSLKPLNGTAADWLIWRLPRNRLDECLFKPAWMSGDVLDLVNTIRRSRSYDLLSVLADALMEAGCDSSLPDLLRAPKEEGSYSAFGVLERACWHMERATVAV